MTGLQGQGWEHSSPVRLCAAQGPGPACSHPGPRPAAQVLTELDQQLSVAPALVGGQGQDAGHVVVFRGLLFLEKPGWSECEGRDPAQGRTEGPPAGALTLEK